MKPPFLSTGWKEEKKKQKTHDWIPTVNLPDLKPKVA